MGWAIIVAKTGGEDDAESALERAGFVVYLPRYRRILRGVRIGPDGRRRRTRGQGSAVLRPLIPPYLFAERPDRREWLSDLLKVRGVLDVMRYRGGSPAIVDDKAMAKFRSEVQSGKFNVGLMPGDRVSIGAGVWRGQSAVLLGLNDRGFHYLMVEIFGRQVRVEVSSDIPLGVITD